MHFIGNVVPTVPLETGFIFPRSHLRVSGPLLGRVCVGSIRTHLVALGSSALTAHLVGISLSFVVILISVGRHHFPTRSIARHRVVFGSEKVDIGLVHHL